MEAKKDEKRTGLKTRLYRKRKAELERAAGGADEIAEDGDVGAVDADAAGIDGQAEHFCLFEIDAGVVEFGEAKTLRGQDAIEARGIHGTGRTMALPRTASDLVELLPVAFVPGLHFDFANLGFDPFALGDQLISTSLPPLAFCRSLATTCSLPPWMPEVPKRFTRRRAACRGEGGPSRKLAPTKP